MPTLSRSAKPPRPISWSPSVLARLRTNPRLYWLAMGALTLITALTVAHFTKAAQSNKAAYGATVEVYLTNRAVQPGDSLADAASLTSVPQALVPTDAVVSLVPSQRASRLVSEGAILTDHDTTSVTLVGADNAAVAIPVGPTTPPLAAGAAILVVIHADPFTGEAGQVVDATVHQVHEGQILVSLDRGRLEAVAAALGGNGVTIALGG